MSTQFHVPSHFTQFLTLHKLCVIFIWWEHNFKLHLISNKLWNNDNSVSVVFILTWWEHHFMLHLIFRSLWCNVTQTDAEASILEIQFNGALTYCAEFEEIIVFKPWRVTSFFHTLVKLWLSAPLQHTPPQTACTHFCNKEGVPKYTNITTCKIKIILFNLMTFTPQWYSTAQIKPAARLHN